MSSTVFSMQMCIIRIAFNATNKLSMREKKRNNFPHDILVRTRLMDDIQRHLCHNRPSRANVARARVAHGKLLIEWGKSMIFSSIQFPAPKVNYDCRVRCGKCA